MYADLIFFFFFQSTLLAFLYIQTISYHGCNSCEIRGTKLTVPIRAITRFNDMAKGRPLSLQTVELRVRMCCAGCERVVKNALLKLTGVDTVEVDLPLEKVTVTGYVDRNKVLKEVRRSGKKAEFWPNPDTPLYFTSEKDYFADKENFRETYNYWRHGYNGDKHGQVPVPQRGADPVSNMFNDDDVNACHVM